MSRLYYARPVQAELVGGNKETTKEEANEQRKDRAEKIAKQIPAEVIAAYSGLTSVALLVNSEAARTWLLWIVFAVSFVVTPFYLWWQSDQGKPKKVHIAVSTLAFPFWAYLTSGSSLVPEYYDPAIAGVVTGLYTLATGWIPLKK